MLVILTPLDKRNFLLSEGSLLELKQDVVVVLEFKTKFNVLRKYKGWKDLEEL